MQKIEFEKAYKVFAVNESGERAIEPFIAMGVKASYARLPFPFEDRLALQWTMATNLDDESGTFGFYGELLFGDGDSYQLDDVLARLEGKPRRFVFEVLTWDRLVDMPVAGVETIRAFAPDDAALQNFFLQDYLDDDAMDQTPSVNALWIESEDEGVRLLDLQDLLEGKTAKKSKRGFPVGTIHKWSDGFDYEKTPHGTWQRVIGQGSAHGTYNPSPPVGTHPVVIAAEKVLPVAEDGWRPVRSLDKDGNEVGVPWLPTSTILEHFAQTKDPKKMRPLPERKKLHDQIVKRMFAGKTPAPASSGPVALVTMGTPASGKSSIVKTIMGSAGAEEKDDFVRCDADLIKVQLPEYHEALQAKCKDAADIVHNESGYVNDRIFDKAVSEGYNLVFDGLGRDLDYYRKDVVGRLKKAGYHVILLMPFIPDVEENVKRAHYRGDREGRWVNEDMIRKVAPVIPKNFRKLMRDADQFAVYSVHGNSPSLVFGGGGGSDEQDVTYDDETYKKFLSMSESVALLLMKLIAESKNGSYAAPPKPPAISYDETIGLWLQEMKQTAEVLEQLPAKYKPTMGVSWPVGEPTARTSGRAPEEMLEK
jgi:predicted ABC-type ATPase